MSEVQPARYGEIVFGVFTAMQGKSMHRVRSTVFAALLLGIGYTFGVSGVALNMVTAQDEAAGLSEQTGNKIRDAHRRLQEAKEALEADGKYEAITDGINSFLVFTGGGNAREDLESGRGVDPETFAGLYAGRALPEIQTLLSVNDQGQITYNNEVVRMYPKSRLQKLFAQRLQIVELGM
ncbi:hypothetical protein SH661x_001732 [Planctomicrobium sp. SH661]|uniref:hypothetical protein n=1 Tax=Planctomicrobium sp. SH661 TaxID=3448124 RepID=UPI003F5BBA60